MTWATSVPILVFLGLSVLDLGPMYVRQHHRFMPPPIRAGIITLHTTNTSRVSVRVANFFIPVRGREGRVKIFLSSIVCSPCKIRLVFVVSCGRTQEVQKIVEALGPHPLEYGSCVALYTIPTCT